MTKKNKKHRDTNMGWNEELHIFLFGVFLLFVCLSVHYKYINKYLNTVWMVTKFWEVLMLVTTAVKTVSAGRQR